MLVIANSKHHSTKQRIMDDTDTRLGHGRLQKPIH